MIARGDLGVEIGAAEVPLLQKRIILGALDRGKPAITATQMLETMVHGPEPTRAEASDIANAILDGTSAVMLSAETAVGEYPVEAVATMANIARAVEPSLGYRPSVGCGLEEPTVGRAMSNAACDLAEALGAKAILVPTFTGRTASGSRASSPAQAGRRAHPRPTSLQHMAIEWGVTPLEIPEVTDVEALAEPLHRGGARGRHRSGRGPGGADRGHRREHPRLDQRHQGRHRLTAGGHRPALNLDAWQGGQRSELRLGGAKVRGRSAAGGSACSGRSRSSGSPSTSTTGRSRRTSRRGTTSPSDVPRSSRWVSCAPSSSFGS